MTNPGLTDIDSLALCVRDRESRRLIEEAISAYRGGALRSAIMSTWIAVAYDIISKARELATHGEAAPREFTFSLDTAIDNANLGKLQAIERDLLSTAKDKLQLFAGHEFDALQRLHNDRNLCAHPAFVTEEELFQPSLELARSHIVHALQILLVQAPLQGKSAVARFEADILSPSFPALPDAVERYMRSKYLDRAKDALVTNLIKRVLTAPFGAERAIFAGKERHLALVLGSIAAAKTAIYDLTVPPFVHTGVDGVDDEVLLRMSSYLEVDPRIWTWLSESVRIRLKGLLEDADVEQLKTFSAFDAFAVPELAEVLLKRFGELEPHIQTSIISEHPKREFVDPAIDIYGGARSYRGAERLGRAIILPLVPFFAAENIRQLLEKAAENGQIWDAAGTPEILNTIFDETVRRLPATVSDWRTFLEALPRSDREGTYLSLQARVNVLDAH